jgi:putative aminopeptidase FrvX
MTTAHGEAYPRLPAVDMEYLLGFLKELLNTPSPTGFAQLAIDRIEKELSGYPFLEMWRTRKGSLMAVWRVEGATSSRALTAHADTLGAMVKEIKSSGRLKMTQIGHYAWNTIEGEGCTIFASRGQPLRGSILLTEASGHVHGNAVNETKRDDENMEVRLDALTSSATDTRGLGISVGDFIAIDPRVEITNNFVRSRHLDDKACVASLLAAIHALHQAGMRPVQTSYFLFSNYEEVGHGAAAGIPSEVTELLTVDMAAVGEGQTSDEYHATLCVKDTGGPYHYELSQRLRQLAEQYKIPHKVDVYPYYGSDGEAYWRAGGDVAVALIGPGVDASHNYERTHREALEATTQWVLAYLISA